MIYYIIAAAAPLLTWYIGELMKKSDRKRNVHRDTKWLAYLGVLPMFLLFVLRYKNVGGDTAGFVNFFENTVRNFDFFELFTSKYTKTTEWGYLIYVKLISYLTDSYTLYFLINGLVIFGSLMHFANKYTKNPSLFLFLFVVLGTYSFVLTGLRQALAMAVCMWAVDFVKKKKFIRFVLTVFLASLFHKSAWIFLMIYPFAKLKRTDAVVAAYVITATVLFVGFAFFQGLFNDLLGYNYSVEETGNGMIFLALLAMMFVFSLYMLDEKRPGTSPNNTIFNLATITMLFWVLRLVSRTAERISYYFITGLYAYFAEGALVERDKLTGVMKWLALAAAFALFVYRNWGAYYSFFF